MGTWNTEIKGNDTTLDVYSSFFEKYNNGKNPVLVSQEIKEEFEDEFRDHEDGNNSFFGLALAQWETKSLEPKVYTTVKEIIGSGKDLKLWEELGADEKTIKNRKTELDNFLKQISGERPKAKRRVRPKFESETKELIDVSSPDQSKTFKVNEEFGNGSYIHTSGILEWNSGGGSGILYFDGIGKKISAKWIDNNRLEITHESDVEFEKKEERLRFRGDEVNINYRTQ